MLFLFIQLKKNNFIKYFIPKLELDYRYFMVLFSLAHVLTVTQQFKMPEGNQLLVVKQCFLQ